MASILAVLRILRLVVLSKWPAYKISWLFSGLKDNSNLYSGCVCLFSHRFGSWCTHSFFVLCVSFLLSFRWSRYRCQCRDAIYLDPDVRLHTNCVVLSLRNP